jgi:hypothetical protein
MPTSPSRGDTPGASGKGFKEMRIALLGPDGPTGTFTRWENVTIPW